jgi:dTDP-4-dehydrorhamnose 3,5-epimerase
MTARKHLVLQETPIAGVLVVQRTPLRDDRGSFERMFCAHELADTGFAGGAVQINRSRTCSAGTVRGLHFQAAPGREPKLVSCLSGAVHDVAVDLRAGSPTFGCSHAVRLEASGERALLLPPGVAHGFQALADGTELLYVHGSAYHAALDAGLSPVDPALRIDWPLPVHGLSPRDAAWPRLDSLRPWSPE